MVKMQLGRWGEGGHGDAGHGVGFSRRRTGVPAGRLSAEITESDLMNEPSVQTTIGELRKHGIKFAIDDFGTGYSSLASLRQLPVDILKIDRSFVSGITTNPQDRALITAAIDLARSFGLTTIAEGVETQEQLRALKALDCELAQGYLWSRPVEADKITDIMKNIGKVTHDDSSMRITDSGQIPSLNVTSLDPKLP